MADIAILDVGHGNAAIVQEDSWTVVIDCAPGDTVLRALQERGVKEIHAVLISHADADHVGGILGLLASPDFIVREIYVNGDWFKKTLTWRLFRQAVRDARSRSDVLVHTELSSSLATSISHGSTTVEVLAPSPELLLGSADKRDLKSRPLTSNSLSAVVRVLESGKPAVLFAGDVDQTGLANLEEDHHKLEAEVLVFPHHGGLPRGAKNATEFAERMVALVNPELVVFSIARAGKANPRPEIVNVVRNRLGEGRVACTQLSGRCAQVTPSHTAHLIGLASAGAGVRSCCTGSMLINVAAGRSSLNPSRAAHLGFIKDHVQTPMCLAQSPTSSAKSTGRI